MCLTSSVAASRITFCVPSPSITMSSRRAAASTSVTTNSPVVAPVRTIVADELEPVVRQRRRLSRQRWVAPTEAPRIEPERAGILAHVVEHVVHQRADLRGRRRGRVHPGPRLIEIGGGRGAERRGDHLLGRREVVTDQPGRDAEVGRDAPQRHLRQALGLADRDGPGEQFTVPFGGQLALRVPHGLRADGQFPLLPLTKPDCY